MTVVMRGTIRALPLRDESVDLIVTSPPYWNQRSYTDGGEHYEGQIGSEDSAQEFLEVLWSVTAECWRVLKPKGSMFVNLGDKRSGSGAPGTTSGLAPNASRVQGDRSGMTRRYDRADAERSGLASNGRTTRAYGGIGFGRKKSKMLLPHRYAIGCEDGLADPDGLGWIVRQDHVWHKPNGLPESTDDRAADKHEFWFHMAKEGDYFAAIDEIREPHSDNTHARRKDGNLAPKDKTGIATGIRNEGGYFGENTFNPLGKLPSSVWKIASAPLTVPEHLAVEHFAAFPPEWPRRIMLGWSPSGICLECGSGRRPVAQVCSIEDRRGRVQGREGDSLNRVPGRHVDGRAGERYSALVAIEAYECDCDEPTAPTRPAVVLDPFGGTGTTAMVARAMGRLGISIDLSHDYCRLAQWRVFQSDGASKVRERRNRELQGAML